MTLLEALASVRAFYADAQPLSGYGAAFACGLWAWAMTLVVVRGFLQFSDRVAARTRTTLDDDLLARVRLPTPAEIARRRQALAEIMEKAGASHVLLSGGDRKGSAIQWLTGWPPGGGHFVVFTPGEQDVSDRFILPEQLFGREAEVAELLTAFDGVAAGGKAAMLVFGRS